MKNESGNKFAVKGDLLCTAGRRRKVSDNLYYRSAGNKATPNIYAVEDKSYIIISRVFYRGFD